ncbi:MAG: hypothetical protein KKB50_15340 [Planctomycetes bacterium]|nr:hypothetical protein [Planctomycetota bacterium]
MTEEEIRHFEGIDKLRAHSWDSFNRRRDYEWKVCLAIWTALLAFAGIAISGRNGAPPSITGWHVLWTTVLVALVAVLHGFWVLRLTSANDADKRQALFLADTMLERLGLELPKETKAVVEARKRTKEKAGADAMKTRWNETYQIGITAVLCLLGIASVWTRWLVK